MYDPELILYGSACTEQSRFTENCRIRPELHCNTLVNFTLKCRMHSFGFGLGGGGVGGVLVFYFFNILIQK